MTSSLMMVGHDRTYQAPRSLRAIASKDETPTGQKIAAGKCDAWDLLALQDRENYGTWATNTADSILASITAEAKDTLDCGDCEDTGFYGLSPDDNQDLLTGLLRRNGEDQYDILTASGDWELWESATDLAVEQLSLELAEDLASAITAGAAGLLRKYSAPLTFLPPAAVTTASAVSEMDAEQTNPFAVVDDDDQGAVLAVARFTVDGDLERLLDGSWGPWGAVDSDLMAIPLDAAALDAVTAAGFPKEQKCGYCTEPAVKRIIHSEGMAYIPVCGEHLEKGLTDASHSTPDGTEDKSNIVRVEAITAAGALVADAPLTVSPDPRAEKLRRYWSTGKGAAKIRWNTPGDWRRCYRHLRKYMGLRAKGYCFTGDTEFVTRDGLMTFADARDTVQLVLTHAKPEYGTYSTPTHNDGYWVQAPISSFGEQSVLRLTVKRGGITKVIRATPEHRWMASPNGRNARRFDVYQLTTAELRPGMVLTGLTAAQPELRTSLPPEAIAAGAMYGDGSMASMSTSRIDLWGAKQELLPYFEPYASSVSPLKLDSGVLGQRVLGLPGRWKSAPDMSWSDQELVGWLAGYIATDGTVSPRGAITLSSSNLESLRLVRSVCARVGIVASGIQTQMRKGYLQEAGPLHRTTLYRHSISDNLLIRKDQREGAAGSARGNLRWTVLSVEDHGEREEVFCATVPETESFALADEIWSLNCQNLHKRDTGVWTGDRRNVGGNGRGGLFSSAEGALAAAIESGQWAGESEGTNMPVVDLKDGIYSEMDEHDTGLLRTLTAGGFPVSPPDDWFTQPTLPGPTPLTVDDDGRVYGHIATFDIPHIGMPGNVRAPKSRSNYAYFRTGEMVTASGKKVTVGQITLAGGHAPLHADAGAAVAHYDNTKSGVADVSAGEDRYGIWVAGAVRPDVTPEQIRTLRASAPSGDWRPINGGLELVAVCQVNVPGFPVARARVAGGAVMALVAAGARPLAERRAAMTADALLMERLDRLEQYAFPPAEAVEETAPVIGELTADAGDDSSSIGEPSLPEREPSDVVAEAAEQPAVTDTFPAPGEPNPTALLPGEPGTPEAEKDAEQTCKTALEATEGAAAEEKEVTEVVAAGTEVDRAALRKDADAIRRDLLRRSVHGDADSVQAAGKVPPQFLAQQQKMKDKAAGKSGDKPVERAGGGYPIKDEASLKSAIQAFGRAKPEDKERTKAHIISEAKKLGLSKLIPENWN